jgi:hypothetical protein
MVEPSQRLTPEQCREKAKECRDIARRVRNPEHAAMLLLMADTWEQLAESAARKRDKEKE